MTITCVALLKSLIQPELSNMDKLNAEPLADRCEGVNYLTFTVPYPVGVKETRLQIHRGKK